MLLEKTSNITQVYIKFLKKSFEEKNNKFLEQMMDKFKDNIATLYIIIDNCIYEFMKDNSIEDLQDFTTICDSNAQKLDELHNKVNKAVENFDLANLNFLISK